MNIHSNSNFYNSKLLLDEKLSYGVEQFKLKQCKSNSNSRLKNMESILAMKKENLPMYVRLKYNRQRKF